MRFYLLRECSSAQIEAVAIVNVRLGATCFGLAYPRSWQQLRSAAWGWRNYFPRLSLALWAHTGQNDLRHVFRLRVNRFVVGWTIAGRWTTRDADSARDAGLNLRLGRRVLARG